MKGEIQFEHVTFRYDGETTLEDITFHVSPGQTVAIVGQTGAGKTSLAKLINRTYDVNQGQVCVDGIDVRDWNLEALRRKVSIIEQDIFLFSRTIAENIAFGNQQAKQDEIECQSCQAHDYSILGGWLSNVTVSAALPLRWQRQRALYVISHRSSVLILMIQPAYRLCQ
jgi:ATP-binding cassette subfamily B protein